MDDAVLESQELRIGRRKPDVALLKLGEQFGTSPFKTLGLRTFSENKKA